MQLKLFNRFVTFLVDGSEFMIRCAALTYIKNCGGELSFNEMER